MIKRMSALGNRMSKLISRVAIRMAPLCVVVGVVVAGVPAAYGATDTGAATGRSAAVTAADAELHRIQVADHDRVIVPMSWHLDADGTVVGVADRAPVRPADHPTPCGNACNGQDPQTYFASGPGTYCANDAYTVYARKLVHAQKMAELRYSPNCRTAWTRGCCAAALAGFGFHLDGSDFSRVYRMDGYYTGSTIWTAMLNDAGLLFQACVDIQAGGSPDWMCTPRY